MGMFKKYFIYWITILCLTLGLTGLGYAFPTQGPSKQGSFTNLTTDAATLTSATPNCCTAMLAANTSYPPLTEERAQKISNMLESQACAVPNLQVGYSIITIPDGRCFSHNGNKQFPLASVFKVPVLLEVCRQLQEDILPLNVDKKLTLKREDLCIGSGTLNESPVGSQINIDKALNLMITISDNTATDMLIHLIGAKSINNFMRSLKLYDNDIFMTNRQAWLICLGEGSVMTSPDPDIVAQTWNNLNQKDRWDLAQEVEQANLNLSLAEFQHLEDVSGSTYSFTKQRHVAMTVDNQSSPNDFSNMFSKLWQREILADDWTEYALSILGAQKYNSRIPRYLPKGTPAYHKTGTISGVVNDSGIIISKRGTPVAVTVFVKNVNSGQDDVAAQVIGKISKIAWDNL